MGKRVGWAETVRRRRRGPEGRVPLVVRQSEAVKKKKKRKERGGRRPVYPSCLAPQPRTFCRTFAFLQPLQRASRSQSRSTLPFTKAFLRHAHQSPTTLLSWIPLSEAEWVRSLYIDCKRSEQLDFTCACVLLGCRAGSEATADVQTSSRHHGVPRRGRLCEPRAFALRLGFLLSLDVAHNCRQFLMREILHTSKR